MSWYYFKPSVSVAQLRAKGKAAAAKLTKKGVALSPVLIEGRTIARTFWGKAWCNHIESYSDYETRLPRGRSYARNGTVIDLQITAGHVSAKVMGSQHYEINITIAPLQQERWEALKAKCAGQIASAIDLLKGKFSDAIMRHITDRDTGIFPAPHEIKPLCDCPDWADLCKHLAAVFYGIGNRLDKKPELLFLLRSVDHVELLESTPALRAPDDQADALETDSLADVFGIDIEPMPAAARGKPKKTKHKPRHTAGKKIVVKKKKASPAKKSKKA